MNLPTAFKDKYTQLLGHDEAAAFFNALEHTTAQKSFRVNTLKNGIDLPYYLSTPVSPAPYSPYSFWGYVGGKTPLHQAGYIYSQEASAMIVATIANVSRHDKVLDLCAAPGGKSTQLAAQLQQTGLLVSNEIMPKRAKILSENIERCGITNCIVTNHSPEELVDTFTHFFDKIIVDAPCSGEGMFRKDATAISEWYETIANDCAKRQKEILQHALQMLKPGGELIYSTCTFAPEENEAIISWLVQNYPVMLLPIESSHLDVSHGRNEWGSVPHLERTIRLWPHHNQGEGHFVAKLRYDGDSLNTTKSPIKRKTKKHATLTKEQTTLFNQFKKDFPFNLDGQLIGHGNHLWLVPTPTPDLTGIKLLRHGLHVGVFLKNRFEPSFALAMALSQQVEHLPHISINQEQWQKYVAGETFSVDTTQSGWVLLVYQGLTVGFGKLTQGTLKNFYPKGLRFKP